MLNPTPLDNGRNYATAAQLRDCDDLPKLPVTPQVVTNDGEAIPFWTDSNGAPLTILVRALTFEERRKINTQAKDDNEMFRLLTCLYGIAQPKLEEDQIDILKRKHPAALDAISETIWQLCQLPAAMVEAEVRRLAGLPAAAPDSDVA